MVDRILGNLTEVWVQETSDINDDGVIDVIDVTGLVGIILNTTISGLPSGLIYSENLNYISSKPVGELKMIYSDNKIFLESDQKVMGLQFSINKSIDHLFNDQIKEKFNIISFEKDNKTNYLIYGNENESLLEFSNILFNYVDKKLKDFEISNIKASTENGFTLNTRYIDESFFDKENEFLKIYPNPVDQNINLLGTINSNLKIIDLAVYNQAGMKVYNKSYQFLERSKMVDLSMLNSGVYFIKINSLINNQTEKTEVFKFIKK
jgi:hypothetical protein